MKKITLLFGLLFTSLMFSQAVTDFIYSVTDSEATITAYTGLTTENIVIPDTDNAGNPVVAINGDIFNRSTAADRTQELSGTITIGANVRLIGAEAFANNLAVTGVVFASPSSLVEIEGGAFRIFNGGMEEHPGATGSLTTPIVFPTTLVEIGAGAFRAAGITGTLTIPLNVTDIGANAFNNNSFTTLDMKPIAAPMVNVNTFGSLAGVTVNVPAMSSGYISTAPWDAGTLGTTSVNLSSEVSVTVNANTLSIATTTNAVKAIEVYNISGKKVLASQASEVSISSLASGVYVLKAETAKGILVKKFVK